MNNIYKPIFIIGVGRSGSTALLKTLSQHKNLAWMSELCNKYPDKPYLNQYMLQVIDFPFFGEFIQRKFMPGECYLFWSYYSKGFRHACRDLVTDDITHKEKEGLRSVFSQLLTKRRKRLLAKITGWPRIGYLHALFPDTKFIHLVRDGRAVANSLLNTDFWWGWRGPQNWRFGELTTAQRDLWEKSGKSFVALAGIEWNIILDTVNAAKQYLETDNFIEIKYEDLCSTPIDVFKEIVQFGELDWTPHFEQTIKAYSFSNANEKWRSELTDNQQRILSDVTKDFLHRYEYL